MDWSDLDVFKTRQIQLFDILLPLQPDHLV